MLYRQKITDKFQADQLWLGAPTIEITQGGRFIIAWFAGGPCEPCPDNCIFIQQSEDGKNFTDPKILVEFPGMRRVYDPCLWMTPLGTLWLTYNVSDPIENYNSFEVIECDDPDAGTLKWSKPRKFDFGLPFSFRLNKPLVTSNGRWIIPLSWNRNPVYWFDCKIQENIAKWSDPAKIVSMRTPSNERWNIEGITKPDRDYIIKQFMLQGVAISDDKGRNWSFYGEVPAPDWAIESMLIEKESGEIVMWIRTNEGHIWEAVSEDHGQTWSKSYSTGIINPATRFYIGKISDGRWLMINTPDKENRHCICAYLSNDEGKTWSQPLLLAQGHYVSYPDAVEFNKRIYCVHDNNRYQEGEVYMVSFEPDDITKVKQN
jgi:predicted neuraminidase